MALGYDPKTSSVTVEYRCDKANNFFYWVTQQPWNLGDPYYDIKTVDFSPKGAIVYEDGTTPTEPVK